VSEFCQLKLYAAIPAILLAEWNKWKI